MPRCFMAKKLKYPYEQWKVQQGKTSPSRSPSPMDEDHGDDEGFSSSSSSPQALVNTTNISPRSEAYQTHNSIVYDVEHASQRVASLFPSPAHLLAAHLGQIGLLQPPVAHQSPAPAHRGSLTPPPEYQTKNPKKDIFRPYCLDDPVQLKLENNPENFYASYPASYLKYRNIEDINTAHAILDLSRSSSTHQKQSSGSGSTHTSDDSNSTTPTPLLSPALSDSGENQKNGGGGDDDDDDNATYKINDGKTTAYTYEAFFASDGRSRKKPVEGIPQSQSKPRYTCSECGKHYATSSNLSRHKQTHRSLDSNSAKKCHVCGKMYVSMPALSMHILTHNLNHKCDVCGKSFSRPWLLQGHMRSHSGDKPYGCAHCGKCFADRSNLRAHMQTHSAFKNFKCKRCNKSFALKSYLNKHYESACFKDQPIPSIDTPPCTPAPSEFSNSDGLISPGARSTSSAGSHDVSTHFVSGPTSSSIATLLSVLPSSLHSPQEQRVMIGV